MGFLPSQGLNGMVFSWGAGELPSGGVRYFGLGIPSGLVSPDESAFSAAMGGKIPVGTDAFIATARTEVGKLPDINEWQLGVARFGTPPDSEPPLTALCASNLSALFFLPDAVKFGMRVSDAEPLAPVAPDEAQNLTRALIDAGLPLGIPASKEVVIGIMERIHRNVLDPLLGSFTSPVASHISLQFDRIYRDNRYVLDNPEKCFSKPGIEPSEFLWRLLADISKFGSALLEHEEGAALLMGMSGSYRHLDASAVFVEKWRGTLDKERRNLEICGVHIGDLPEHDPVTQARQTDVFMEHCARHFQDPGSPELREVPIGDDMSFIARIIKVGGVESPQIRWQLPAIYIPLGTAFRQRQRRRLSYDDLPGIIGIHLPKVSPSDWTHASMVSTLARMEKLSGIDDRDIHSAIMNVLLIAYILVHNHKAKLEAYLDDRTRYDVLAKYLIEFLDTITTKMYACLAIQPQLVECLEPLLAALREKGWQPIMPAIGSNIDDILASGGFTGRLTFGHDVPAGRVVGAAVASKPRTIVSIFKYGFIGPKGDLLRKGEPVSS